MTKLTEVKTYTSKSSVLHHDYSTWCTVPGCCAHRLLIIEGKGLACALLASGIPPYDVLFNPRWLKTNYVYNDSPDVLAVIEEFNSGKFPVNDPLYLEQLDLHDDEPQATLSDICKAADKLFDDDGKFHPERLDDVVGEMVGF